jgi:hypothetical protein
MIDNALNNTKDVALVKVIYEKWSGKTHVEDTSES